MTPTAGASADRPAQGWLLREPSALAASLLFCVPYLGTGASMYHGWPRTVGNTEVCPLQPPGRENRLLEPAHETYASLAADLVDALADLLERPYAFFAHCNSVYVACEAILEVERRGLPLPGRLMVSSMVPPGLMPYGSILDVPEGELSTVVAGLMRARGMEPDPELIDLSLGAMEADVRAYRRYRPDFVALPCPVTAVAWARDTEVPPQLMAGWANFAETELWTLPGDHWTFLSATSPLTGRLALAPAD